MREISTWETTARRRRRRLIVILVPAIVMFLVATGFTTYALTREPTVFESVGCFERPSLDANVAVVANDGRDPAVICDEVFRSGDLSGAPPADELVSCVLGSGAIGVFPGSGPTTCESLGLADLPPSYAAESKRFAAVRDAIVSQLGEPASGSTRGGPECVGEAEARAIVRRELDAHGYVEWEVRVAGEGFSPTRPCADVSFDGAGKAVLLLASGPR